MTAQMRWAIAGCAAMVAAVGATAQTSQPAHLNIVALGDSITEGISYDEKAVPYPDLIGERLGERATVQRVGQPGGTTLHLHVTAEDIEHGVPKNLDCSNGKCFGESVLEAKFPDGRGADVVLILAGVNDVATWERSDKYGQDSLYRPDMIRHRLGRMCELALESKIQPVLMTFWPDGDEMPAGGQSRRAVAEVNAWILHEAGKEVPGLRVVDTAKAVTDQAGDKAGGPKAELHDGGFLHLSAKGYQAVADAIVRSGVLRRYADRD